MNNLKKTLAGIALSLSTMATATAGVVVLDDFSYAPNDITLEVDSNNTNKNAQINDINSFGADVKYDFNLTSTPPNLGLTGKVLTFESAGDGILSLNNDGFVNSTLTMTFGFFNSTPPPSSTLDLTLGGDYDMFYVDFILSDLGISYDVTVNEGSNSSSYSGVTSNIASGSTVREYLSFSDFTGGADFTNVDSVVVNITGGANSELALTEFGIVPEPASLAIFGAGLLGLAGLRRRKNQA